MKWTKLYIHARPIWKTIFINIQTCSTANHHVGGGLLKTIESDQTYNCQVAAVNVNQHSFKSTSKHSELGNYFIGDLLHKKHILCVYAVLRLQWTTYLVPTKYRHRGAHTYCMMFIASYCIHFCNWSWIDIWDSCNFLWRVDPSSVKIKWTSITSAPAISSVSTPPSVVGKLSIETTKTWVEIPEEVGFNVLEGSTNTKIMTSCDTVKSVELNHILTIPFFGHCVAWWQLQEHMRWYSFLDHHAARETSKTWHTWPTVCHMSISHMLGVIKST